MQNPVPKELRNKAVIIKVNGTQKGEYYLVPYNGKLRKYTDKEVISMFVPQERAGKEKMVPVSVVLEDKVIYITMDNYKAFGNGLQRTNGIDLIQRNLVE